MRSFLNNLILFAIPILITLLCFEFFLRNMGSVYAQKRDGLIQQKDSIEILILGTSHAKDGIVPNLFSKYAYNLAYDAQSLLYDNALLIKYGEDLPKLKYVLISVDYPSLYWGHEPDLVFFYDHYYNINLMDRHFIKEKLSYFFYVYSPKVSLQLLLNHPETRLVKGWTGYDNLDHGQLNDFQGRERVRVFNRMIEKDAHNITHKLVCKEIKSMIDYLKNKSIIPVLVTAPCYKSFNKYLDPKIVAINKNFTNEMRSNYNIDVLDFQFDSSFTEKHFFNVDHLNTLGATMFTKKLDSCMQTMFKKNS